MMNVTTNYYRTDKTGQTICREYNNILKIQDVSCDSQGRTIFRFVDDKGLEYIHYQLAPENTEENCRSKALQYFKNFARACNLQREVNTLPFSFKDFLFDATVQRISSSRKDYAGFVFPVHIVERKSNRNGSTAYYRDVDQIYSEKDNFKENLMSYKELFKKRRSENLMEYLTRITEIQKANRESEAKEKQTKGSIYTRKIGLLNRKAS